MTTYPPAPLTLQNAMALDYTHSQIAYVGYEGTIFHLSGPFAPVLGAQTGAVLRNIAHLDPSFKHLDNKGARQDGTTWYDSLYDPTDMSMVIELGGVDAPSTRKVIADWFGAWDPKQTGKLCWWSPERGEWFANVRMNKSVPDQFKQDWYQSRGTSFTWACRNDDAFWQGVDSVCNYTNQSNTVVETFQTVQAGLGPNWSQTDTGGGSISVNTAGQATWNVSGSATGTAICQYVGQGALSGGDSQHLSVTLAGNMPAPSGGANAYIDIWGRMDAAGQNGVRARFGYSTVTISTLVSGTLTQVYSGSYPSSHPNPVTGDVLSLQCGVTAPQQNSLPNLFSGGNITPTQYQVYLNGNPLIVSNSGGSILGGILATLLQSFFGSLFGFFNTSSVAPNGPTYRGWGFGMSAGGTGSTQLPPPPISQWSAGSDTGFIKLTNIGDQPGWPRYLCYGPGTFLIGDGASSNGGSQSMISFGPLLAGQVAMLSTLPRLPGVIDMSPPVATALSTPQLNFFQSLETGAQGILTSLINFVTNNNVPPLLQQFESLFGITPPQGPLYSLLNGRFTQSLAPMLQQVGPQESHIPCQIQGGNNQSKIVAAVTPMRRWPE